MDNSIKKGFSFGLTSGIITTLGLMVGMYSVAGSKEVVIGSIITIAIADSLSDGLGMHLSEESQKSSTQKSIWKATFSTILTKALFAFSFIVPVLLFSLQNAVRFSIFWGLLLITIFSYLIAKDKKEKPIFVILEHIAITVTVIILTYLIGNLISVYFN